MVSDFLAGSGATTISRDNANQQITISSTDTNTQLTSAQFYTMLDAAIRQGTNGVITRDSTAQTITIGAVGGGGTQTLTADQFYAMLEDQLVAGSNVTFTTDSTARTITISSIDTARLDSEIDARVDAKVPAVFRHW